MATSFHMQGLFPAVFTPMDANGSLHLAQVAPLTKLLIGDGVTGCYICGSTGEGPCLSREERMDTAEAYIKAAAKRVTTVVHVIDKLKVFRILQERYCNRRKRFGLRLGLIAGIYNCELALK